MLVRVFHPLLAMFQPPGEVPVRLGGKKMKTMRKLVMVSIPNWMVRRIASQLTEMKLTYETTAILHLDRMMLMIIKYIQKHL